MEWGGVGRGGSAQAPFGSVEVGAEIGAEFGNLDEK